MAHESITYNVVITPDDGAWGVTVPDIPGCVTWDETVEEAEAMAKEAITGMLKSFVAHGQQIPVPTETVPADGDRKVVKVTVDLPPDHRRSRSA